MKQLFPKAANTLARMSLLVSVITLAGAAAFFYFWVRSPYVTKVRITSEQAVPFSHKHHVDGLGIDCRFCHVSAEKSSFAGIPPTETCMKCHSVIWKDSDMLAPVRESFRTGKPLVWNRVHNLADYVFFDHSIHVQKGVGCVTCHGRVDQMPLVHKAQSLQMQWCLSCHVNPEKFVQPREEVFNTAWKAPAGFEPKRKELAREYQVQSLTSCNTCHR